MPSCCFGVGDAGASVVLGWATVSWLEDVTESPAASKGTQGQCAARQHRDPRAGHLSAGHNSPAEFQIRVVCSEPVRWDDANHGRHHRRHGGGQGDHPPGESVGWKRLPRAAWPLMLSPDKPIDGSGK